MYPDRSLIPKEAIRMAALGALLERPRSYGEVASEVRQFSARIVGPSLDMLAPSIELLKLEGLIAPVAGGNIPPSNEGDAILRLTDAGRAALADYLRANLRPGLTDLNKLVLALKLRFIGLLDGEERREQIIDLKEMYEGELVRLSDLQKHEEWATGLLPSWTEIEIGQVKDRIAWCEALLAAD
jgi:DNA-binding PadR family transcriptional regulator